MRSTDPAAPIIDNSPAYIRGACEGSLRRLGIDAIDIYYVHRIDPARPIEELAVGTMADLVREGKVRAIGLSEVSANTLVRRGRASNRISAKRILALDSGTEFEVLPACRELGVSFVAFSPLGRGFLAGAVTSTNALAADDYRRQLPRQLVRLPRITQGSSGSSTISLGNRDALRLQLAIAWLLAQGP